MKNEGIERRKRLRSSGVGAALAVAAVAVVLGGCSSVPDAVNPVKWYQNTVDYFSGNKEKEQKAEAEKTAPPGANKPFPNLASVPAKPEVSSSEVRSKIAQGLVGDREGRTYAAEVPHQGAATHVLGNETTTAPTPPGATASVPSLPVASAPPPAPAAPAPSAAPARPAQVAQAPSPLTPPASSAPPPPPNMKSSAAAPASKVPAITGATAVAPRLNWPVGSAHAQVPAGPESFETVVVSSSGVNEVSNAAPRRAGRSRDRFVVARRNVPEDVGGNQRGSIRVATIQFPRGSAELDARDRAILRDVVELQRERGGTLRVVGHASSHTRNMDAVHHELVNYDVSSARAETVAQTLAKLGARTKDLVVVAKSDADPLYYEFMPSGEAGNRRAEVYLDF